MRTRKLAPIFFDLDETLVYADESQTKLENGLIGKPVFDYLVYKRPEADALLSLAREGGREVYLFTHANFGYACEVSKQLELGFDETTIFSFGMILNCRKALCPDAILIENKPPSDEDTQIKMEALGIGDEEVWLVPSFEAPEFKSATLFLAGFAWRISRL